MDSTKWDDLFAFQEWTTWAILPTLCLLLVSTITGWYMVQTQSILLETSKLVPKPRAFRVTRIPIESSPKDFLDMLGEPDDASSRILNLTLAAESRKYSVATFTCTYAPSFKDRGFNIDTNFFGVTPLVSPSGATVE